MDILLDGSRDIDLSTGDLQLTSGSEALLQRIERTLLTFKGEFEFDTRIGVPWRDIFTRPARLSRIKSVIRRAIESVDGVDGVLDLVLSFDGATRTLTVSKVAIKQTSGETLTLSSLPIIE